MAKQLRYLDPRPCSLCSQSGELLYRVVISKNGPWLLVCPPCWLKTGIDNPHYRYGGTWKARKRS
ncbi:hypothetical protein [Candidatus Cyanaurora vandensis]|uniref:hypothetical protein n=1 Tax=Candidatus Cyanaurora vandensis TaxID=2714958 RepID=UPI002579A597|nr:hypothetical protein [Candidatus Cyanaurora vandensis]